MSEPLEVLHRGRFLELRKHGRWEYVARHGATGSVHVLAVTDERELLLVEQYRVPVQSRTLELPAGVIGDEAAHRGERPESCGARELEEETGYRPAQVSLLQVSPSAPGLSSEIQHLVRAVGLTRVGPGGGVDGENITVHRVPLAGLSQWLAEAAEHQGLLVDHRIHAALYHLNGDSGA